MATVHFISDYGFQGMRPYDNDADDATAYLIEECGSLDLGAIMSIDHSEIGLRCDNCELIVDAHSGGFEADIEIDGVGDLRKLVDFIEHCDGTLLFDEGDLLPDDPDDGESQRLVDALLDYRG